ncbi:NBAS subunit of NRZ tethering complex-like isoform X2 [Prorops nasuta]|uniref:NBAS subunit of NRZ tethering complex-like isoform X2 n=1 Tax=Prorops nasuta TaxID=863751 RepID=UPI0034CEB8F8
MSNLMEKENDPILYELLEYYICKQGPELIRYKNDAIILPSSGTIKNALRYLNNRYSLPESISQQVNLSLPWKFALADYGRLLAILQENVIEIRKAKDEYSSIISKALVPKDAFPQWRKIAWSPDGSILVLASSYGFISFYNSLGNNIFNITPKTVSQSPDVLEAGDAIASMLFLKPRDKNEIWSFEFILITYSGLLKSYKVSTTNGYKESYEFSFGSFYKNGINTVAYDDINDLLYVAGNTITQRVTSSASETGLTSWRFINDYPYCKLSVTFDQNEVQNVGFSIWNILPTFALETASIIFRISISFDRRHLICLHTDGSVSLWSLPNLILKKKWRLLEQPDFNIPNPLRISRSNKFPQGLTEYHPVDIGWWSNQAVIITRYLGSTSVCSIQNLNNLLGGTPEFLADQPQISELGSDKGFLCLDCETFITSKKRSLESNVENQSLASSESEREEDDLEPITILSYATNLMQRVLYSLTDFERFQPKRKKSKLLYRTYRILGLKSTTPEELYTRKIDIEEYEEALTLAKAYNLDTDLVYQTQWRKSEHSVNDIKQHLSKVSKRLWVLNECVTRVPNTLEAASELLNFGLKCASWETFLAIGEHDDGRVIASNEEEDWIRFDGAINYSQIPKIHDALKQIDLNNLSDAQKNLMKHRKKLLEHMDKLMTYEIILEPSLPYNKFFYQEFRELSAVENAKRFAENGDCRGVEIMFTYHGSKLFDHWLPIISFFPETLNPKYYKNLLPKCDGDNQIFLLNQQELRQKDWSEIDKFSNIVDCSEDEEKSNNLYSLDSSIIEYRTTDLTCELLRKWYKSRAYQIERNSFMTDNALELIKIAISHNINGLEHLILDLETLDDLVYKVYLEEITLDLIEKLTDIEKIKLLMSKIDEKNFIDNIKDLLLPFIRRNHKYLGEFKKHLLNDYLIYLSKSSLTLTAKFFEYIKESQDIDMLEMVDDIITLAVNCIYACNDLDMYQKAKEILDFLPEDKIHDSTVILEDLENELQCANILRKYSVRTTLSNIRNNKNIPEVIILLFTQMARNFGRVATADEDEWAQLLNEMLEIHGLIFSCVDVEVCFEICVSARLVSGNKTHIQNCAALIETRKKEKSLLKVSYEKAVNLILDASKEYFNSSKSLIDPNMELAKACLHLITDNNREIKEECDLINSLQILHEFNIDILPLKVRFTQDRLKLIQDCLNKREDAYKSKQRLLTLANYLRIEEKNSRVQEGKVLELIAKKALELKDYTGCMTIIQQLITLNYIPAWKVISSLGLCDHFEDLIFRRKCLWFVINNGPSEILQSTITQVHLIDVKILNKDLQSWTPIAESDEVQEFEDDQDQDAYDTNIITTGQKDIKEFVPQVLETSSEIVKSSATLVKKSTFDLIRNASDKNFWKFRLRILSNFASVPQNEAQYNDEYTEEEDNSDLQSFPFYYKMLHKKCRTSNNCIKYSKYSMPDVFNRKLKYCQTLLRIALLSESSCLGLEASDINHLLLECAKEILCEDWLLGISYLLSLDTECTYSDAQTVFMDLPRNDLYIQTAAYYYSIQLHKKMYPEVSDIHLYDPIDLICKMKVASQSCEDGHLKSSLNYWCAQLVSHENNAQDPILQSLLLEDEACKVENNDIYKKTVKFLRDESKNTESTKNFKEDDSASLHKSESNKENITKSDIETEGWTEDWGDFSDEDIITEDAKEEVSKQIINQTEVMEMIYRNEDERFLCFQNMFANLSNKEEYQKISTLLKQWPKFTNFRYTSVDNHPILSLMMASFKYIFEEGNSCEHLLLNEYKQLISRLESAQILQEFLEENDKLLLTHKIYMQLCTNDELLQEKAIHIIKENYQKLEIPSEILEEIFIKDLTYHFHPDHAVFKMIIEYVFIEKKLKDVENNGNRLISKLIDQKHIVPAMEITNLMEHIPPSMNTFENSLQLLIQRKNYPSTT